MKSKFFIATLSLMATSAYAQPSVPAGGMSPPVSGPEVNRQVALPSPQVGAKPFSGPALNAAVPVMKSRIVPFTANGATNSVNTGATSSVDGVGGNGGDSGAGGNGGRGGNGAAAVPTSTMYSGVDPLPANDAKASVQSGTNSQSPNYQKDAEAIKHHQSQTNVGSIPLPQPAAGATGGTGGNGGLIMGNGATPKPSSTISSGVGPSTANAAKAVVKTVVPDNPNNSVGQTITGQTTNFKEPASTLPLPPIDMSGPGVETRFKY